MKASFGCKWIASAAPIIAGAALLAGCTASSTQTPETQISGTPAATTAPAQATITWSYWGDPWETEVNSHIVSLFQSDHPEIRVNVRHASYTQYFDEVEKWIAGNDMPDVMFLDYLPTYASRGVIENLDPYIQKDGYDLSDFYPGLLEYNSYDGSLYGLPRDNDTKVIFYNKTLFDQAGVSYPASGWTWQDMRQAAIKLTAMEDGNAVRYGFAYEPDDWWLLWVRQNGGEVYDSNGSPTRTLLGSDEATSAIQWLADLTNVDRVTPPYDMQNTSLSIGQLFLDGKLAMAFGNHALMPAFAARPDLKWDVVGLPKGKVRVNSGGGSGYVISSQSKQKQAAWTFLKWLESPKGQAIFAETGVVVPARRSVGLASIFLKQKPAHNAEVFIQETEQGRANPVFNGVQEVTRAINTALVPVWKGRKSASEAIAGVAPAVDSLLARPGS